MIITAVQALSRARAISLAPISLLLCICAITMPTQATATAEDASVGGLPIEVVVWDERQPTQKQIYPDFLGNRIAEYLRSKPGFHVTSVCLDDPDQGLPDHLLKSARVLVWWGHIRNGEVKPELGQAIAERIASGRLGMMCLHSAHWSIPFMAAMNAVTIQQAIASLPANQRATAKVVATAPAHALPRREDPLTPHWVVHTDPAGVATLDIALPMCVFPAYRADAKPSHMTTLLRDHPIARGVPETFDIAQTEMYDEPFHVPIPDQVVFNERWDSGEHFRSGMIWHLGGGVVVYFRPGHEIYPVYQEEIPLRIVENTCRWMATQLTPR